MSNIPIALTVNGEPVTLHVSPWRTLVQVLREDLMLTGTKETCAAGLCGACTVLVDGEPVSSCIKFAFQVRGRHITTIEGVAGPEALAPLQEAFITHGAIQCGYCTPGMILMAKAALDRRPDLTEPEIRHALEGNTCRCTGYVKILDAVLAVARSSKRLTS